MKPVGAPKRHSQDLGTAAGLSAYRLPGCALMAASGAKAVQPAYSKPQSHLWWASSNIFHLPRTCESGAEQHHAGKLTSGAT